VFAPGNGSLWTFYNSKLAQYVTKQGSRYEASNAGAIRINPAFVAFFNRAATLTDALYSGGSPTPHLTYSLKQGSTNINGLTLKIGNEAPLSGAGQQKTFNWTGASEQVLVSAKDVPIGSWGPGPWAAFHFISDGHPAARGLGAYDLGFAYKQSNGQDIIVNGQRQSYSYQLQFTGPNPLADFAGLSCVSTVAH
jgi:type VI secretion system protein ImpL